MGSINGIGTGYRGWRHGADGESVATLWLTFVYLPVLPLRRCRVRNHTDFAAERNPTLSQAVGAIAAAAWGTISWEEHIEVLERTPLAWREIAETYARSYLLLPLLCLWPFPLLRFALRWIGDRGAVPQPVLVTAIAFALANAVIVLLIAVRRMRGAPPRRAR